MKFSVVKGLVISGVLVVLVIMLLPALMHAPSKYGTKRTPPGALTVLRQVHFATMRYEIRENKAASSLDELMGVTVRNSKGENIPFSIKSIQQELGSNAPAVKYFPEFTALDFGVMLGDRIVLAYVSESAPSSFSQVIFRSGRIQRTRTEDVEKRIQQLRSTLTQFEATNKPPQRLGPK